MSLHPQQEEQPHDVNSDHDEESLEDKSVKSDEEDNETINSETSSKDLEVHRGNDRLMAKQFRKSAIESIDEKRELFIGYKKEQKGRMISFLTCILMDPLTPIFNQFLNDYLKPINFSIFEGIHAEQVKKLIVSKEQIEMLQQSFQKGDGENNIFQIQTKHQLE